MLGLTVVLVNIKGVSLYLFLDRLKGAKFNALWESAWVSFFPAKLAALFYYFHFCVRDVTKSRTCLIYLCVCVCVCAFTDHVLDYLLSWVQVSPIFLKVLGYHRIHICIFLKIWI